MREREREKVDVCRALLHVAQLSTEALTPPPIAAHTQNFLLSIHINWTRFPSLESTFSTKPNVNWDLYRYYYDPRDLAHVCLSTRHILSAGRSILLHGKCVCVCVCVCACKCVQYRPCVRLVSWPIYISSDGFLIPLWFLLLLYILFRSVLLSLGWPFFSLFFGCNQYGESKVNVTTHPTFFFFLSLCRSSSSSFTFTIPIT